MSVETGAGIAAPSSAPRRAGASAASRGEDRFNWPLVLMAYAVVVLFELGKVLHGWGTTPLLKDTDDAMRLVTVRDLLAGQNWFDHTQYRLNTPYGAEIHWSHLVDAGIGGLVLLLRPVAGGLAETAAVLTWPLLLLLPMLALSARLAFRLAGRAAILPAVILTPLALATMNEFVPGRIDHDSIQILLLLLMALGAIEGLERSAFGWLAGAAAAVSLAIGIENLAGVVAAVLAFALMWVIRPARGPAMRSFGLSFGGGTVLMLALADPPTRWLVPAVDEISIVYATFAVGVAMILTLLSVLPLAAIPAWRRLALGGALGLVLAGALVAAFPITLGGPYAGLDPWLVHNWLDRITEAKSLWAGLGSLDAFAIGAAVPVALALGVIGFEVARGPGTQRDGWLVLGIFLGLAGVVMCVQIRGAALAEALIAAPAAMLILKARARYLARSRVVGALGMIVGWLGFAELPISVAALLLATPFAASAAATSTPNIDACRLPQAYAPLAALPKARVMSLIDLGSHVLLHTPDSVVAAPYHRDQQGLLDAFHFFDGPIAAGRDILARRGVSLVVVCRGMPELTDPPSAAPDSFVRLFAADKLPGWLEEVSPPGAALTIYRVTP
jgi:hypothetical protein